MLQDWWTTFNYSRLSLRSVNLSQTGWNLKSLSIKLLNFLSCYLRFMNLTLSSTFNQASPFIYDAQSRTIPKECFHCLLSKLNNISNRFDIIISSSFIIYFLFFFFVSANIKTNRWTIFISLHIVMKDAGAN